MFTSVKQQVRTQFDSMVATGKVLFTTDAERELMWNAYLDGFPTEEERQHHNCNCCRIFIKNYGKIVIVEGNEYRTVWDFIPTEELYRQSVRNLQDVVRGSRIQNRFINDFANLGTDSNIQKYKMEAGEKVEIDAVQWNHFFVIAPLQCIVKKDKKDTILSEHAANKSVFKRGLEELTIDASETVLELIAQGSLYRGDEFKGMVEGFLAHQKIYRGLKSNEKDNYVWFATSNTHIGVMKIRNSAIGTLLIDLSEGTKSLDQAVTAYEKMVAPTNYKRPTALITPGMIKEAEKAVEEMGIKESLGRRFAIPEDISVDNVLFVNRDAKVAGNVFEEMKEEAQVAPKSFSGIEEVPIDKFLQEVVPTAKSIEVLVENSHLSNLVSVIAPVEPSAPSLFKWNNPFSWSYVNALTDSIKEKVKDAGGNVEGVIRISLAWNNFDDLDIWVEQPDGKLIGFNTYRKPAKTLAGGQLDVDMNAGSAVSRTPVENITWDNKNVILEGKYTVKVNQFQKREASNIGFTVEVECNGELFTFENNKSLANKEWAPVCEFNYSKANGVTFSSGQTSSTISKEKWGINTNKFQKVSMIMNSPNHWENQVGNKHVFFVIEGAKSDETPRGFFNEFLKEDLDKNRKVFEVLGAKLKVEPSDKQLTGVGFSTTQRNHIICRVEGNFKRVIKVVF